MHELDECEFGLFSALLIKPIFEWFTKEDGWKHAEFAKVVINCLINNVPYENNDNKCEIDFTIAELVTEHLFKK